MRSNDAVSFRVESERANGRPGTCVACPARTSSTRTPLEARITDGPASMAALDQIALPDFECRQQVTTSGTQV